jgi:hypothetical protein
MHSFIGTSPLARRWPISAARDPHSSAKELSKFGFPSNGVKILDHSSDIQTPQRMNSSLLSFGRFSSQIDVSKESNTQLRKIFIGSNCARILCARLPIQTLEILEDQRQAGYNDEEIMHMLNLPFIPPKDISFEFIGRCYRCGLKDHLRANCPGICLDCQCLGHRCPRCSPMAQHPSSSGLKPTPATCYARPRKQIWWVKPVQKSRKEINATAKMVWVPKKKKEGDDSGNISATAPEAISPPPPVTSPAPPAHQLEAPLLSDSATMATFPVNPLAFLPDGMTIDQGPPDARYAQI